MQGDKNIDSINAQSTPLGVLLTAASWSSRWKWWWVWCLYINQAPNSMSSKGPAMCKTSRSWSCRLQLKNASPQPMRTVLPACARPANSTMYVICLKDHWCCFPMAKTGSQWLGKRACKTLIIRLPNKISFMSRNSQNANLPFLTDLSLNLLCLFIGYSVHNISLTNQPITRLI